MMESPDTIEEERIKKLYSYEILDTPADGTFDKITALAAKVFSVPIAIISLVDVDRIWFKSHYGVQDDEIKRDLGLCASAILSNDIYLIDEAKSDPRCLANPLVAGDFGLNFYVAAPLTTKDGYNLGTLCLIDKKKRNFDDKQQSILIMMAEIVMEQIEIRLLSRNLLKEYLSNRSIS
jgi:GAF domain-containing protein